MVINIKITVCIWVIVVIVTMLSFFHDQVTMNGTRETNFQDTPGRILHLK